MEFTYSEVDVTNQMKPFLAMLGITLVGAICSKVRDVADRATYAEFKAEEARSEAEEAKSAVEDVQNEIDDLKISVRYLK